MQGFGHRIELGDVDAAWEQCEVVVEGEVRVGGQEHFYLEPQGSIIIPGENDEITVISSTQVISCCTWSPASAPLHTCPFCVCHAQFECLCLDALQPEGTSATLAKLR